MYLSKFDEDGRRIATVLDGIHFSTDAEKQAYLDDGYVETSEEDYAYYVGNRGNGANGTGYIRGADGKPTDAPAVVVTTAQKQASIAADYESQISELKDALATATLAGDESLIAELKEEYAEVKTEYEAALKEAE
nr:hypothetical protein [Mitsuokella multacida]